MRTEAEMVAYALEADPALLPYLPELLSDLEELGSDAAVITRVLAQLDLPAGASVVDLGCGKGAVAVAMARELDVRVLGIELFEPFIESCQALAEDRGVSGTCRFRQGDILKLHDAVEPADVVVFAALGDVLGPLDETVEVIRRYVRPGGFMVISDGYLRDGGHAGFPGFEQYVEREATHARLTGCGDILVAEVLPGSSDDAADDDDDDEAALIRARAEAIARREPAVAEAVMKFADDQAAELDYVEENLVDAVWVLRRAD